MRRSYLIMTAGWTHPAHAEKVGSYAPRVNGGARLTFPSVASAHFRNEAATRERAQEAQDFRGFANARGLSANPACFGNNCNQHMAARYFGGYPDDCSDNKTKDSQAPPEIHGDRFVNLLRELYLGQEFLVAGIGMDGIESGILAEPVQATTALISLVQPLECTIFFPQLRVDAGDFVGTNVGARPAVPRWRGALALGNFPS